MTDAAKDWSEQEKGAVAPKPTLSEFGKLIGLLVHDLRNPGATIGANVAYAREVAGSPDDAEDLDEALQDVELALRDLMRGLEQLGWLGRWLMNEEPTHFGVADVGQALSALPTQYHSLNVVIEAPSEPLNAVGGGGLTKLIEILLANSAQHARRGDVVVRARGVGQEIVVEVQDQGPALHPDLRATALSVPGQQEIKGRPDGRYGRVAGLVALQVAVQAFGGRLEFDGTDGQAVMRIVLPAAG